jgi:hypothetical protein
MAEIEYGGSAARQSKLEKDDEYKPVHKTEEFREVVRRIKEKDDGRPITPSIKKEEPKVTFNVPMPSSIAPRGGHRRGSSFDKTKYEEELYKTVRTNVEKQTPTPGFGVSKQKYEERIDKETKRLVDIIKRPRYVMLSDGTPFYLSKKDEREELEKSLLGESAWKKSWTLAKYDIANGISGLTNWIGSAAVRTKELLTDTETEKGNVVGAGVQLAINSAMLSWEYLRAAPRELFVSKERYENLERQAEALKYTDPEAAAQLQASADHWKKQYELKLQGQERMAIAERAVDNAWQSVFTEVKESNEFGNEHYDPNMRDPNTGRVLSPIEQQVIYERKQRELAEQKASSIRTQVTQAYAEGDFQKAIELTKEAQEEDRKSRLADPYGAYTWVREPERYAKFKEDAALLELQKGAPLTDEEIRRLKEYHANAWTELTGEFVFDPVNLVPAAIMAKVYGVPLKGIAKTAQAVNKEVPIIGRVLSKTISPVKWMLRETVQAGGNKVKRTTYNILQRVSNGFTESQEVTKAIDELSNAINDARRAGNENDARAIFETARKDNPGLQQITFTDFKKLMDAGEHIDPTEWGKMYGDALSQADDQLSKIEAARLDRMDEAQRASYIPDATVADSSRRSWALEEVAEKFKDAYVDPHRIYKGSNLTDDTIGGWVSRTLRELSDDEVSELLTSNKFHDWAKNVKLGDNVKALTKATNHFLEASLTFGARVRDIWAGFVLTTFRWPANNLVDTSMRSVVYGGSLWDDVMTLLQSTQRQLADEIGMSPLEFNNALGRHGVDFTEQVPHKLLYEGWKPKFGIFSYIADEYRRVAVKGKGGNVAAAKYAVIDKMVNKLPNGGFKKNMLAIADGMNYRVNLWNSMQALAGGVQDFNTAIEFTFRLRMFHREYTTLLKNLDPKFAERGMDALNPATREIAKQIWNAAGGNPRKITAYVDNLLGGSKNAPASWSVVIPPEVENMLGKKMDAADKQLFISSVQSELDDFIETAARNGKELSSDDFKKFFEDYERKMQDELQHRLSQMHDYRGMDDGIRTDGKPNEVLTEDDVQGSLPIPKDESPRNADIEAAIGKLNRKKWFQKPLDIHNNFEDAIRDYAQVERVSGDGMRVVKRGDKTIIEVGDNLLKKNAKAYYNAINDAVITIFKNQDADLIRHSGFASADEYAKVMREFFDDPTAVLAKDERQFLALVNQMENHPNLRRIIEQTSPETVRKYDSALDIYREIGEYSDVYGFNKRPDQIMMSEAEKIRPLPGSHVAAANDARVTNRKLLDLSKSVSPEIEDATREFIAQLQVFRQELKQFYSFTYPGPLMRATTESGRHSGWDLFYRLSEAEFRREAAIGNQLIELLQKDPEAAKKMMAEANDNFAEYFLKENGIELEWDADRQMIMNIKVKGLDGKIKNFTSRRDIANLQIRFFSPSTKRAIEGTEIIKIATNNPRKTRQKLMEALRSTFQTDTARAEAWSKVIYNHAEKWAQETKQPIEKYFERLGFQHVDSSSAKGLGTLEQTRIVKRGAVKRNDDGTFMFFGLSHSNFESMVRETGELFFDDLVSMADHSQQAADDLTSLKNFLEKTTGKKIRGNRLEQVHSDVLSDTFSSYIATGHGPDIKIKNGFGRLKKWLTTTFDAVRDSKVAGEIPDDTYRVLDRMFVEAQIFDVPQSNRRAIQLMAKEANLVADSEDDLLKIINDALAKPSLSADEMVEVQKLEDEVRALEEQHQALLNESADLAGDNAMANATIGNDPRLQQIEAELENARNKVDAYYLERTPAGKTYETLGDVPKDVAARLLGTPDKPLESKIAKELQEGWEVWRTNRNLAGFPDEALVDPDTFKAYLRQRMGEEWGELENHYNRLLWEVEQFEDAMLNFHAGGDLRTAIFPRVHEAQVSNGMKTYLRNTIKAANDYEVARQALRHWSEWAGKMATEGHPAQLLTKEDAAALKAWAYGDGSKAKAELIETVLNGNAAEGIEGAIPTVNKRMLDYEATNVFDQTMKNFFPFWMFPSRSFPFWAETLATHPQLIAGYEKIQRLSRSQRYQAGAVTSQGKPLPSLDGYVQIPGTDTWFNPLAPLSFRYLLDVQKSKDDILYAAQSEDDVPPGAFVASELMQSGQLYGFSLAPWAAWSFKKAFGIPDEIIPRYPLIPEIQLIPRWMVQEHIQRLNQMNLFGQKGLGDAIYPEVPWHDYMVERRILENALQQIQSGNLSEADKLKLMNKAQNAIKHKGNDALWQQAYREYTSEEAGRSIASFFSGIYAKNFGDGEADLLALRNELNLLKSSLNNEFQASVFDLPVDAETGWQNYLNKMDSPEGWVHRLYTDIGWVKNEEGELVRDPADRAKWLAVKIEQDEDQQMYYDKMANLQTELNKRLRALPIGADWEQAKIIFDWYATEAESLDYLKTFEKVYGSNKPVELIQKDIANDWFRKIKATQPRWDYEGGETYQDYQERVMEWENNLPNIAPLYMRAYMRRRDLVSTLGALKEDQQFNTGEFFQQLVGMSTKEGLEMYEKENDDVFDALNKAWKDTYWSEYWNSVIGKDGYEVDLAEQDFYSKHQQPPSTDELYQWIVNYYGPEKFTRDEIAKYVEGTDSLDIEERRLQGQDDPADYKKRQEIWDMLSWAGPGNKNRGVFEQAFKNAGGDPDWLTTWYQESGQAYKASNTERLDQLHAAIQQAVSDLGLKPPARAELVRYVQAQKENDTFKQLITAELGNDFYDYEDEDGIVQQGIYSYYNSLDYENKKQFRKDYPDEYDKISSFYDMKEMFQDEHPVWADYYGFDTEPSVSLPTNEQGSTLTPPSYRSSGGGGGRGGGGGSKPVYRPTQTPYGGSIPQFNIYDRTSNYISPGLFGLAGNKLGWEITQLYSSGRRISQAGQSFLRSLRSRYPEYQSEIDRILAKG